MLKGTELDATGLRPFVLALHGAVVNAASWLPLKRALGESVECVAIDLPGHGTNRDVPFSIVASLKLIATEISRLEAHRPVVLVGDSLGGYLALLAGAESNKRVQAVVAGGASFEVRGLGGALLKATDLPVDFLQFCLGRETSERLFRSFMRRMTDAETIEAIVTRGIRVDGRHESIEALRRVDILAAVRACPGRVYMVNGGWDIPAVWFTRSFARAAKDGYAVVIPGALHGCAIGRPVEFADIVRTAVAFAQVEIARSSVWKTDR